MIRTMTLALIAGATFGVEAAPEPAKPAEPVVPMEQQVSYVVGYHLIQQVREAGLDVKLALEGAQAAADGKPSTYPVETVMAKAGDVAQTSRERMKATLIDEAAKRPGAQKTASGIVYEVIKAAEGAKPGPKSTVKVHYVGTLLSDGSKFDSSRDRGEPTTFPLDGVIAGWTEGLQLMSVGSTYRFTIPWKLAYGESGRPPSIPPKSDLVFEVELIAIEKP